MFYSHEILCARTGSLAILWLAATKKPSQIRRLLKTNLIACLEALNRALPTLALRLQASLLLGAIRIYVAQISSLFTSALQLKDKICLNVTSSSTSREEEKKKTLKFEFPLHPFDELPSIESFSLEAILKTAAAEGENEISRGTIEASLMEIEASRLGGRSSLSSTGSVAALNARLSSSSSMQNAFGFDWNAEIPPIGTSNIQKQDFFGGDGGGGFPEQETTIRSSNDSSFLNCHHHLQERRGLKSQKRPFDRIIEIPNYISQAEAFSSTCKERWNHWQKVHNLALEQAKVEFSPKFFTTSAAKIHHSPEKERREESSEAAGSGGESFGGGGNVSCEDWPFSSPSTKSSSEKKLDFSPAITRRASFTASPLSFSFAGMESGFRTNQEECSEEYPLSKVAKAKEAAEVFFRLLIMASSNLIRLEQRKPYAPIRVISSIE